MPAPETHNFHVDPHASCSLDNLRQSLHDFSQSRATQTQAYTLAEIRQNRAHLSNPLNPTAQKPPNPEDRQRLSGRAEIILNIPQLASQGIRLGPDLVSVAVALSDELYINEIDAGILLYEARTNAAHRPDHNVVNAARDMFFLRRRESVWYLQEILRAGLLTGSDGQQNEDDNFVTALMRERDVLVVDCQLFDNVQRRLTEGMKPENRQRPGARNPRALQRGEAVLLAETLFLLAYTVQLTSSEALSLRSLLDEVDTLFNAMKKEEEDVRRVTRAPAPFQEEERKEKKGVEFMSAALVEVESVRNLVFLAWVCALDRSRYHDLYDPRSGVQGVNLLLKDLTFVSRTIGVPQLDENEVQDKVSQMSRARAAAELCGAVFRLAVAMPDEDEALWTALRVSAFGGALSFLGEDLADWIEKRAGSICPDTDLYADVVEDLSLDVAEAPQLVTSIIQFTQNEVQAAASEAAYAPSEENFGNSGRTVQALPNLQSSQRRSSLGFEDIHATPAGHRRHSSSGRGRPPLPPGARSTARPQSVNLGGYRSSSNIPDNVLDQSAPRYPEPKKEPTPKLGTTNNLMVPLASFIAHAVTLAPSKLRTDSVGGGLRYWSSIGPSSAGVIQQIGDAVIDLWDASMRNPYAPGGVGEAFQETLNAFLRLLACTAGEKGSPSHASSALRFLRDSGQSAVSLEKASEALAHFIRLFESPSAVKGAQMDIAEANALGNIIDVVANAAETLQPHGGIAHLLGEPGKEFAMRMASLATHDIPSTLKDSLLRAICGLNNRRAISLFLESVSGDNSSPIRRFLRSAESPSGAYQSSIQVLVLTSKVVSWGDDDFPDSAVDSIATWFAVDEVLAFWSRRKYSVEAHRWKVVRFAANLISRVVQRNPTSERSFRILARLLTPAPGTGAASFALRTLVCAAGLMRAGDGQEGESMEGRRDLASNDRQSAGLFKVSGREALIHAAEHGLGEAYREMQYAAQVAARLISLILSVPSGRVSVPGMVVAPASELLFGEVKALTSAASLVFAVNGFIPAIARAGYVPSVCAAILGMLAKAAQESQHLAGILARDTPGTQGSAAEFRTSLASIVARSTTEHAERADSNDGVEGEEEVAPSAGDPPMMLSALRIVEASLGTEGGSQPGMALLGLKLNTSGFYESADYGVLGALVELVAGAHDSSGRVDDKSRSTAATFLERLAANTVRRTSIAVLEHLKEVAGPEDPRIRGGGFADEMLFRILEVAGLYESGNHSLSAIDWNALGELLTACMSLSALQVRMFPKYELERCIGTSRGAQLEGSINPLSAAHLSNLPSPINLLKLLAVISGSGEAQVAFEGLRTWAHLLGTRLSVHDRNTGYNCVPVLYELATLLLGSLAGSDSGSDLSGLVKKDGGEMASSVLLLCVTRMLDCDNPQDTSSEEYIGDVQCTSLISGIIRAIAAIVGFSANAARARTSLYATVLVCGFLSQGRVSEEALNRVFGGRHGPRNLSGAEILISSACADAVSGPSPAAKAAAMAAASITTLLDPLRCTLAFGNQSRLRKVVQSTLASADSREAIAHACSSEVIGKYSIGAESAKDKATLVVAESALSLIRAISSSGHGARVSSESGYIEAAGLLLAALSRRSLRSYDDGILVMRDTEDGGPITRRRVGISEMDIDEDVMDSGREKNDTFGIEGQGNELREVDIREEGSRRLSLIASVTGGIASVIACANGSVVEATVKALDESKDALVDLLREFKSLQSDELVAVGHVGMIISKIPYGDVITAGGSTQVRNSLAGVIGRVIPAASSSYQIGASGSPFSIGFNLKRAENAREARRSRVFHPEGGSLFERDLIRERAVCAQTVLAALRCPSGVLYLFSPQLGGMSRGNLGERRGAGRMERGVFAGELRDIVRICRAGIEEMRRSAEESMQMDTRIAGESGSSISSRRVNELTGYCQEEYGIEASRLNGEMVIECLRKSSGGAREHADVCIGIVEGTLFILREYVRSGREAMKGEVGEAWRRRRSEVERDNGGSEALGREEGERLVNDAKRVVVPICKEVEGLAGGVWGSKDGSFCKQLCRQIRTACSGRG